MNKKLTLVIIIFVLAVMVPATVLAHDLGEFTYNHAWAPGWNTDGRNDQSWPLDWATVRSAEYLVLEFTDVPYGNIELVMMSEGNGWGWTQTLIFDPEATEETSARIRLAGVAGWNTFASEGPGYFGLGGIGDFLSSASLVLRAPLVLTIDSRTARIGPAAQTLDAAPFIEGGRTMVPFRFIGEQLGATVGWEASTSTASFTLGGTSLDLTIGERLYDEDGAYMGTPMIVGSRTFVPVRFVSEAMGASVTWDGSARTVTIPV
jgi:hypothetical protein